nr:MAG TPA: hypothetical protein [Caudoviricetes sp.]
MAPNLPPLNKLLRKSLCPQRLSFRDFFPPLPESEPFV